MTRPHRHRWWLPGANNRRCLWAGLTAATVAACTSPMPAPNVLQVAGPVALIESLDTTVREPQLINLNNPTLDSRQVNLGDGEVQALFCVPATSVTWHLDLRAAVRLVTAVGLLPTAWSRSGDGVRFRVFIDDGTQQTLLDVWLDPRHRPADQGWRAVDIDLKAWQGRVVRLTLATDPGPNRDPTWDLAVWSNPSLLTVPSP